MKDKIEQFVKYVSTLDGDEKGEAQVFCDRLFQAFGHGGYKEAGATLEFRVKSKNSTRFADLLWGERVLIEMKKKGTQLQSHRSQIFDYWWKLRPNQPKYAILCNFSEFIIYDFAIQDEPLDRIKLRELPDRYTAFNFMLPKAATSIFRHNLEEATRETAHVVAKVFNSLIKRGEERERAQRFILQCIFTMFAEDYQLLPKDIFAQIILDCQKGLANSYDLFNALFNQMNSKEAARGGRFKDVKYFNGGLFAHPEAIELTAEELEYLHDASTKKWNKVNPAIFGTIFQSSMGEKARHAFGAHFTTELDILKIVHPTIIQPWREKIIKAKTLADLKLLRKEIASYKVLDPACGSGNFLYVAFREFKRVEMELLNKIHIEFPKSAAEIGTHSIVSIKQFYGMDYNHFAVELAKVTLMLAKEIAIKETEDWVDTMQIGIGFQMEATLPLDNMDDNILHADALFSEWPTADVIIGNPPYQSKNKMQAEYGIIYLNKLWNAYPEIPGRADYCVYWFYKAHKNLKENGYAGLVGTDTIRQNYSRQGGLEYIVNNNGSIFNAISTQPWSGEAKVHVSIVNWKKGDYDDKKILYCPNSKKELVAHEVGAINSSLSLSVDLTSAKVLECNKKPKKVFKGQTHGHEGFLLPRGTALTLLKQQSRYKTVLKPYLIGDEFVGNHMSQPERYVIDFSKMDILEASKYQDLFNHVKHHVLPDREVKALAQKAENEAAINSNPKAKVNKHHLNFYNKWWQLSYGRKDMVDLLDKMKRYIVIPEYSLRGIFDFISTSIRPNAKLIVFAYEDDYTYGIIQSNLHWEWAKQKGATLGANTVSYTTNTVWDTYPFPQNPNLTDVKKVAIAARELREKRSAILQKYKYTFRDIYRLLEEPGANPLKELHQKLDDAVFAAYNFTKRKDMLTQLLELNHDIAAKIKKGEAVQCPGLPRCVEDQDFFVSDDSITVLEMNDPV